MDTVLIVDDDEFNREGLRLYLERKEFVVYESGSVLEASEITNTYEVSFAIIDIVIPSVKYESLRSYRNKQNGIALARQLKEQVPTIAIVLFSAYPDYRGDVMSLLTDNYVGGVGYKLKGCQPEALYHTMMKVRRGYISIDTDVTNKSYLYDKVWHTLTSIEQEYISFILNRFVSLTNREQEVARLVAASHTQRAIALMLGIQESAVESYTTVMYQKLGLSRLAKEAGLRPHPLLAKALLLLDLD